MSMRGKQASSALRWFTPADVRHCRATIPVRLGSATTPLFSAALRRCRMDSAYMPERMAQRDAARFLAETAEASRIKINMSSGSGGDIDDDIPPTATITPLRRTVEEGIEARRRAGVVTPARYIPRTPDGTCFTHRVATLLEEEARRRCLRGSVWYTAAQLQELFPGRSALEPGVSVALGVQVTLVPLDAFVASEVRALLAEFKLPKKAAASNYNNNAACFTACFDGRPYARPWMLRGEKWRQTNTNAINSELIKARLARSLDSDLWIDVAVAERLHLTPVNMVPSRDDPDATNISSDGRYAPITVDDGNLQVLFTEDMLNK